MSRVLPNAMVAQAFRRLGIRSELLEADLPPMIDLGLQKLYGFQHEDGGWGWWYDDSTAAHQTAYVLFGLAMTEQAGFDVDDGVLDRGFEALRRMLAEASAIEEPRTQAYGAYVLAMAGRPVSVTVTLSDALELDLFSQAALAIAFDTTGDPSSTQVLLDNLREAAVQEGATVHWPASDDKAYSRKAMGSDVRATAMVVHALARLDPEFALSDVEGGGLLPGAVRWLMAKRQGQGWGDTQRTSFAILALSDYLLATQELAAGSAFEVYVNGRLWQDGVLEGADAGRTLVLTYSLPIDAREVITAGEEISPTETLTPTAGVTPTVEVSPTEAFTVTAVVSPLLRPGENEVRVVLTSAAGRLYYAATLTARRRPGEDGIPALAGHERSIAVQREYRLHDGGQPLTAFEFGDLVEVRLTLEVPQESWYVVVDDPLPAGFEALNERLGTTGHVATAYWEEPTYYWETYGYNRKDVRDERVTFFVTRLSPGQKTLTYLMRATTSGSFTALPAQAYPMYEPEVWSRSESVTVRIAPR